MRRAVLYLLIVLLPLQSWAVASLSHAAHGGTPAGSMVTDVQADLPCHGQADPHASDAPLAGAQHDGGDLLTCGDCQVCDLCHLAWSFFLPAKLPATVQAQRLPTAPAMVWPSRHWPPPLEPPRL